MKRTKSLFLISLTILLAIQCSDAFMPASAAKNDPLDVPYAKHKFEPRLWDKVQALQSNGTMKSLSLIIRLVEDQRIAGMQIGQLKNYATSLLTDSHSATVYSICNVLPILMAKVSVVEAERIAAYEFVESIGDGMESSMLAWISVNKQSGQTTSRLILI